MVEKARGHHIAIQLLSLGKGAAVLKIHSKGIGGIVGRGF